MEKLDELKGQIMLFADNPYIGTDPRYMILRRQGYKVLITEKNLVFYKIDEKEMVVTVYAVVDRRQDYLNIICRVEISYGIFLHFLRNDRMCRKLLS